MLQSRQALLFFLLLLFIQLGHNVTGQIPLPEHPRPDFERQEWINLNGIWDFTFNQPTEEKDSLWHKGLIAFNKQILVPFPWGSPLSEVEDKGDVGWYKRTVKIPESWNGKRVFLVIGASDWQTRGWLDGEYLGENSGGYTPFEFELTSSIQWGEDQKLVLKADDQPADFKLYGKQGYGNARGIWQTVYLEARGDNFLEYIHFTPDIDNEKVTVTGTLYKPSGTKATIVFEIGDNDENRLTLTRVLKKNDMDFSFEISLPDARLWTLEDPHLYSTIVTIINDSITEDKVSSYFGMRKINVVRLPGTDIPYIALNDKPVYLQLALDQAYHPEGYYTFPSDKFIRDDMLRTKKIGLNGQRVHVKIPLPRKLYWADKLGLLIMSDIPNSWGVPDANMQKETEHALREMIKRDFNHPSVFSWVLFNETWRLCFKDERGSLYYSEETKIWVTDMYHLAKKLDPTRLVEDNSPCLYDHVKTDINSWHAYLPGYAWHEFLDNVNEKTFPGSDWNFTSGYLQEDQPMINSECGNVWGYTGSTGDIDWSWDYHQMINAFRRYPKTAGWLYTEHHDVINEWNGYFRYDRSEKITGFDDLMPGMTLRDLHSPVYIVPEMALCHHSKPKSMVTIPLWISVMTDQYNGQTLSLKSELVGWNELGNFKTYSSGNRQVKISSWESRELQSIIMRMPDEKGLFILRLSLMTATGEVIHRNFTTFNTTGNTTNGLKTYTTDYGTIAALTFKPNTFKEAKWGLKQWGVLNDIKVNGAGAGYFQYEVNWPDELDLDSISSAVLRLELAAKQLFGKDKTDSSEVTGEYMKGGGMHDPGKNPNAYPMTDEEKYPSLVRIYINDQIAGNALLPDDPADHRGILSWDMQLRDGKLHEAGSYGYLVDVTIDSTALETASSTGKFVIRLEVDDRIPGGLAVYGANSGRYPLDPTLLFIMK